MHASAQPPSVTADSEASVSLHAAITRPTIPPPQKPAAGSSTNVPDAAAPARAVYCVSHPPTPVSTPTYTTNNHPNSAAPPSPVSCGSGGAADARPPPPSPFPRKHHAAASSSAMASAASARSAPMATTSGHAIAPALHATLSPLTAAADRPRDDFETSRFIHGMLKPIPIPARPPPAATPLRLGSAR